MSKTKKPRNTFTGLLVSKVKENIILTDSLL